jgi:hypothetical protein
VRRAIFISYRRDDTEGEAGRLFDDLVRTFNDDSVFMDVAGINPGIDFRKAIDDNVATCGVLLAMIGPNWTTITNSAGERRLDDVNDFVRLEIGSALARNIAVIPVLVHDAKMPRPDDLPDNLKDLAYRNSVEITHARWNSDVQLLTKALGQYVAASSATSTEPVHATVSVQLPPPNVPAEQPGAAKISKMPLMAGAVAAVIVVIGVIAFFAMHHTDTATQAPIAPAPAGAPSSAASPASDATSPAAGGATGNTPATPSLPDWASAMMGEWVGNGANAKTGTSKDPSPKKENELGRLKIASKDGEIRIHAWGSCRDCDWGSQIAVVAGGNTATATWDFAKLPASGESAGSGRVARVTVSPDGDKLNVVVRNEYTDRGPNSRRSEFDKVQ